MKIKKQRIAPLVVIAAFFVCFSCTKTEIIENIIDVPTYPDLEDIKIDTLRAERADIEFYGAYSANIDRWYVTLFTDKDVTYDLGTDTYKGKGSIIKLCLQTGISGGKDKDIPTIARTYTAPDSYSDLEIGQFETGYSIPFDHPYFGKLDGWYGSYFLSLDGDSYAPLPFFDGRFSIRKNSDGSYRIEGMLVDDHFTKQHFIYEGKLENVTEYEFPGTSDSCIDSDVTLTKKELPIIAIRDKGDQYRYDNSFRNYRVYLTGPDVHVSEIKSIIEKVKLSGHGPVMFLDLFVSPDADGHIPAGEYQFAPREANRGIDGSYIKPFRFVAGYPRRYSDPQGCWFFNLDDSGLWAGDYAMINGGKLSVSYENGSDTPTIKAELLDCSYPAKKITIDWK
ncbi:MAG: hypothetical protein MJY83_06455 [Bacteroidales bacterium]|nr:hypothetical protein [Bacteroidales bacterium]